MKRTLFVLGVCALLAACSTSTKTILLYPQGQNADAGIVENGVAITQGPLESNGYTDHEFIEGDNGNIAHIGDSARMDIHFPKKPNGLLVVNCAGGGYWIVSAINEGKLASEWLVSQGVTVCDVKYRLPNGHWRVPLQDIQNAFRYCRAHAAEWGISKIGVMGYSAGGHLAACVSNLYVDDVTRPDFSVLIYPVISMDTTITHMGTHDNLLDGHTELEKEYSMETRVTPNTPPTFIALSADDGAVPPENSFRYFQALTDNGVVRQMHVYPSGGHGWGFNHEPYAPDRLGNYREVFYTDLSRFLQDQSGK